MDTEGDPLEDLNAAVAGRLDKPTSGTYRVAGTDIAQLDGDALARLRREHFGFR
jgi:macrolide transport system ATP-binding/permease protein